MKTLITVSTILLALVISFSSVISCTQSEKDKKIAEHLQALQSDNLLVRKDATRALGKMGKDAVPALIKALADEDVEVRGAATTALWVIGEDAKEALPTLRILASNDPREEVKTAAKEAIRKIEEGK